MRKTGDYLFRRIHEITALFEKKHGCRISIKRSDGHPAVLNDPQLFEEAKEASSDYRFHTFEKPFMQAEDFSANQRLFPVCTSFWEPEPEFLCTAAASILTRKCWKPASKST
jgi:metal-dependent amidase/aminoacylase/carboxypeptidase family protein